MDYDYICIGGDEMHWNDEQALPKYLSRSISKIVNAQGDEIELENFQYQDHYRTVATICQEKPPFKDFIAEGFDYYSERNAAEKALKQLYSEAYPYPSFQFIVMNKK